MATPTAPLSRSKSFRDQMRQEGVDVDELYDVDTVAEEAAELLTFDATQNAWGTTPTTVRVARRMFAHGNQYGCIRIRDLDDGRVKVLKKSLVNSTDDELYDDVKSHALGELCCRLFRQVAPDLDIGFMPRVVYKLIQRSNRPKIMCEELITEGDEYHKRPVTTLPPPDASPEDVVNCHKWAAFQYFTYLQSQRGMVFERCDIVHGMWMNPVIHSNDQTLGGGKDGGPEAVQQWADEFGQKYSQFFGVDEERVMQLNIEEMLQVMTQTGCFGGEAPEDTPQRQKEPPSAGSVRVADELNMSQSDSVKPSRDISANQSFKSAGAAYEDSSPRAQAPYEDSSPRAEAPLESKPVDIAMKLALHAGAAGVGGSPQRVAFNNNLTQDLSNASGLPPDLFEVTRVSEGGANSVIIDVVIHPDPSRRARSTIAVATDLDEQAVRRDSPLCAGVLCRHLQAMALPTLHPGSMERLLSVDEACAPSPAPAAEHARASPAKLPMSTSPASGARQDQSAADDAQLAALKAKLSRYQTQSAMANAPAAAAATYPHKQPTLPHNHGVQPMQGSPLPHTPPARASKELLSPPIATMLEESVVPASTLPVYEQMSQSQSRAQAPGEGASYLPQAMDTSTKPFYNAGNNNYDSMNMRRADLAAQNVAGYGGAPAGARERSPSPPPTRPFSPLQSQGAPGAGMAARQMPALAPAPRVAAARPDYAQSFSELKKPLEPPIVNWGYYRQQIATQ